MQNPQPPRDLSLLIQDSPQTKHWLESFRKFLTSCNDVTSLHCLEFVLDWQAINAEKVQDETLFKKLMNLYSKHFCEQSPKPVPLQNQVLREELCLKLQFLHQKDVLAVQDLLVEASRDNKVWKSGLETKYKQFLATKPAPCVVTAVTAVLLSIL